MKNSFLIFYLFVSMSVIGQDSLNNQNIEILTPYKPIIDDADKKNNLPRKFETEKRSLKILNYELPDIIFRYKYKPTPIKAVAYPKEKLRLLENNYIRIGGGYPLSAYMDLFLNSKRSKYYQNGLFVNLNHWRGLENELQKENNADIGLFTLRFFPTNTLSFNTSYSLKDYYYYGIPELDYDQLSLKNDFENNYKQRLGQFNIDLGFFNHKTNSSKIDYNFKTGFSLLQTYEKYKETVFDINGQLTKLMSNKDKIYIDLNELMYQTNLDSTSSNNIFKIKGAYLLNRQKLHIKLGINAMFEHETKAYILPEIYAETKLINSFLIYYNGWKGEMNANNLSSLVHENPYISFDHEMSNSTRHNNKFSGIKGHLNSKISYNLKASFDNIQNAIFFRTDSTNQHLFQKESANVDLLNMSFELTMKINDMFELILDGDYYNYDMNGKPWHMPDAKLGLIANYNIGDKVNFSTSINYWSTTENITFVNESEMIPSFIDANLHMNYNYRENISFKIMLNNLLGKTYNRWANYPVVGFNGMAGIQFSF